MRGLVLIVRNELDEALSFPARPLDCLDIDAGLTQNTAETSQSARRVLHHHVELNGHFVVAFSGLRLCLLRSGRQGGQLGLRLLQPVRHPHLSVHRGGRGEVLLFLLALAHTPGELAEAEVAVGDERAQMRQRTSLTERRSRRTPAPPPSLFPAHYSTAIETVLGFLAIEQSTLHPRPSSSL